MRAAIARLFHRPLVIRRPAAGAQGRAWVAALPSFSNFTVSFTISFLAGVATLAAQGVWTDPQAKDLPADYAIQGEYLGQTASGKPIACQVIALGKGEFQAVLYPGGLPGDGWQGKSRSLMAGKLTATGAEFTPADGSRNYLAGPAQAFSATAAFPPPGHHPARAAIAGDKLTGTYVGGEAFTLAKTVRTSPTLGMQPPAGALVLFDGKNAEHWQGGRVDPQTGLLNTDGKDILTRQKFNNYQMHLEFMLPYRPDARGQGRGNSGFYQVDHYEVQILDSFGLEGKNNECGGVYSQAAPLVNMCLPPLTWQTYDVEFQNAVVENGAKVRPARLTVKLNGVLIHDGLEITGKTGGSRPDPEGTPGPIKLQGHGNPLQFRNVWIVPRQ